MKEINKEIQQLRSELKKYPHNIKIKKLADRLENQVLNELVNKSLESLKQLKKAVKGKYQWIKMIGGHDHALDELPPIYEENLSKLYQAIHAIKDLEIDH